MDLLIELLEYIGVFAFAASGAVVAMREKLDLFGIYCVAVVSAMGGGVLRDIVADVGVPVFFTSYPAIIIIFAAATAAIILRDRWKFGLMFVCLDAVGLAVFVVSAGLKAIDSHYNLLLFLFVSAITGVGGSILRDIICNRKPVVFQSDIYSVAGLIGAFALWFLYKPLGAATATYIALTLIVAVRMFCYTRNINLPTINYRVSKHRVEPDRMDEIARKLEELGCSEAATAAELLNSDSARLLIK